MNRETLDGIYMPLRLTYGLVPLLAGLDKFLNLLTDWGAYLSPAVTSIIPASVFMPIVGVVEIVVGIAVLTRWTRLGAQIAMVWLIAIAANLMLAGSFDVAVRDLAMAVGAYTLARVAALREAPPVVTSESAIGSRAGA